jgi:PAS domain S-box-containing protein
MSDPNQRMGRELARLEQRTQLILTSAGEGIYGLDNQGNATFVNPAAARILGWQIAELLGQAMHANHHHSHADGSAYDRTECPIYAAFKDGHVHSVDNEVFWRRDGSSFPVEFTSTPIHEDGELVGAVVVFRDVTQRRRADQDLRAAMAEIEALKDRLEVENDYLQEEIRADREYGDILGDSAAMVALRKAIETVAPSEASVLITGETGTGKELVASALHEQSPRADRPLVRVNCASIPRELFESEFFGHQKGSFTGAVRDRAGRFQVADRGTLFLDEVGEIPLDLQGKLLRALQEGQFSRVGEDTERKVDVRVVAATNRDLQREVRAGTFREDLYYRLTVFPIWVPPLRERKEDIPLLAQHFVTTKTRGPARRRPRLRQRDLDALKEYDWPGNIRELQNVIERALIGARGGKLAIEVPSGGPQGRAASEETKAEVSLLSYAELKKFERDNVLAVLNRAGWKIAGPRGAAEFLGVNPATLVSRLRTMGIERPRSSG